MGISPFRTSPSPGQIQQTEFELGNMFLETESKHINTPLQTERHSRLGKSPDSHSVKISGTVLKRMPRSGSFILGIKSKSQGLKPL